MNMHSPITSLEAADEQQSFVRRNRRALIIGALVLAALVGYILYRTAAPADAPAAPQAPRVTVIVPGQTTVATTVRVNGSIGARREMPVGVQGEGGMITAVLAQAGDFVGAGQVLARVDRSVQTAQLAQMQAQAAQADADVRLAQAELDRALALVERGFVSKADIDRRTATRDSAVARARAAVASVREMQARIARLDIRAPAAGLVLARAVEPGQIVGAGGQPLFRIAENGQMELEARVAEQDMVTLRVGRPAQVRLVGETRTIPGQIWLLEPTIDQQTRQGIARIALPRDPAIRSGAFAGAEIEAGVGIRPVLPQSAVLADPRGSYVYVIGEGGKIVRRDVKTGSVSENGIMIESGLTGRERVVLSAGAFLNEGETVVPVVQPAR